MRPLSPLLLTSIFVCFKCAQCAYFIFTGDLAKDANDGPLMYEVGWNQTITWKTDLERFTIYLCEDFIAGKNNPCMYIQPVYSSQSAPKLSHTWTVSYRGLPTSSTNSFYINVTSPDLAEEGISHFFNIKESSAPQTTTKPDTSSTSLGAFPTTAETTSIVGWITSTIFRDATSQSPLASHDPSASTTGTTGSKADASFQNPGGRSTLTAGQIAGIVMGAVAVFALILGAVFIWWRLGTFSSFWKKNNTGANINDVGNQFDEKRDRITSAEIEGNPVFEVAANHLADSRDFKSAATYDEIARKDVIAVPGQRVVHELPT